MAGFAPDRSRFDATASGNIVNAVPIAGGWGPMRGLSVVSEALADAPKGAVLVRDSGGAYAVIAGTTAGLYLFNPALGTWSDISGASAPYSVPEGEFWSFAIYGAKLIAANIADAVQVYDIDAGGTFADLAGSPPQARFCFVANGYLVLAGTNASDRQVRWSGLEDIETWTIGEKGADAQDMPDGGVITGGLGDETGAYVFQRDRIRRMQFAPGSQFSFAFSEVNNARGAVAPGSIVPIGLNDFVYLSGSGFYRGAQSTPIGAERVDRWFYDQLETGAYNEVIGAADPFNKMVWFVYADQAGARKMVGYDWQLDRWTSSDEGPLWLVALANPGYSLEDLDDISASIDDLPFSLDSPAWTGGRPVFAGFDASNRLGFFEGANLAATLESAEVTLAAGRRAFVSGVRPMTDADDLTGQVGAKARESDAVSWGSATAPSSVTGLVAARVAGRLHAFRLNIAAGDAWTVCHGVDAEFVGAGRR